MPTELTNQIIYIIQNIPKGKVLTYGRIAKLAGSPRAARTVSWLLHSSSGKYSLPWHRVINSKGLISLTKTEDKQYQRNKLKAEGVVVSDDFKINLNDYMWKVNSISEIK